MTTVLDTTVLLNFGRFKALWVLERSLPAERVLVPEVEAEIVYPPHAVQEVRDAIRDGWLQRHLASSDAEMGWIDQLRQNTPRIGSGELSSLAVCLANGWSLASDDREARKVAIQRGLTLTGTIGILIGAIEDGVLAPSEAERLFEQMLGAGFRAPVKRLAELLDD